MIKPSNYKTGKSFKRIMQMLTDATTEINVSEKITKQRLKELDNIIKVLREPKIVEFLLLAPPEFSWHLYQLGEA